MKIEEGTRYLMRNGGDVGPMVPNLHTQNNHVYPWVPERDPRAANAYTDEGRYNTSDLHRQDIVGKFLEPAALVEEAKDDPYTVAAAQALDEVHRAKLLWPNKAASAHEQFAVTDEELDELMESAGIERMQALIDSRNRLWGHVKVNQKRRNLPEMRKEAIQVAAMALRFAVECCDETTGRK